MANVVIKSNMFCIRRPVLELLQVRLEKLDDIIPNLAASVDVKRQLSATLPVVERMQVAVRKQHDLVETPGDTLALQRAQHVVELVPRHTADAISVCVCARAGVCEGTSRSGDEHSWWSRGQQILLGASNTSLHSFVKSLSERRFGQGECRNIMRVSVSSAF